MSESQQQSIVIQWFRLNYSDYIIHSIPNGTHIKSFAGRMKAKAEGLTKGVSDLFVAVPRGGFGGMYIEMKDKGKTEKSMTPEQKAFIHYAQWVGYKAVCCCGADQAINAIEDYINL